MKTKARIIVQVFINVLIALLLLTVTATTVVPLIMGAKPLVVESESMEPAIKVGDLVIVKPVDAETLVIGDTITFQPVSGDPTLVTHRIIEKTIGADGLQFTTLGDNNDEPDAPIIADQVNGKVIYTIPAIGQITLVAGLGTNAFLLLGVVIVLLGLLSMIFTGKPKAKNE